MHTHTYTHTCKYGISKLMLYRSKEQCLSFHIVIQQLDQIVINQRLHRFSHEVVNDWNLLPANIVDAPGSKLFWTDLVEIRQA